MLRHLSIKNYALIQELSIDFSDGLSIITGETGAGKSILLGALGLVLGNRADLSSLMNSEEKCVIEAQIDVKNYNLESYFTSEDLDYELLTILRREILPSGKSRAFVNDTPVNLQVLTELKKSLIDIHSQHQTLEIANEQFQFQLIDSLAGNQEKVASYKRGLIQWNKLNREIEHFKNQQKEAYQQHDYNLHLFEELGQADLKEGEQEDLEERLDKLNNIEDIKTGISEALHITVDETIGLQTQLNSLQNTLQKISKYSKEYDSLLERITSVKIELDDIANELENENEQVDFNPNETEALNDRLQLIYTLQKKHFVNSIEELIEIQEGLSEKVSQVENADHIIAEKESELKEVETKLNVVAQKISESRKKCLPTLTEQLESIISDLGMQQARFNISMLSTQKFQSNGKDELSFLFSANKGGNFGELKKVASGGELSRIMLAIKKVLSENSKLPTIIFDEIDTGVSGEISNKMAIIMQEMSRHMQVITITHLPQIAAKGDQHYKVYKEEQSNVTTTCLKRLKTEERVVEIAEMLGGKDISQSAVSHAKELLN